MMGGRTRQKFIIPRLQERAMQIFDKAIDEVDIRSQDITKDFYRDLYEAPKDGVIVNINVNGTPASGKSTLAFQLGQDLITKGLRLKKGITLKNIARDQEEELEMMKDPEFKNTVLIVDEYNALEETGENSSVIQKTYESFTDIQAQRWVHKIKCSPQDMPDKNAKLVVEVQTYNPKSKITFAYCFYRFLYGGEMVSQIVGHVKIDCTEVLNAKWYEKYRQEKMERFDLITKEGIFRPRELGYAKVQLDILQDMKILVALGAYNDKVVRNAIRLSAQKQKVETSIIGVREFTDKMMGILEMYKKCKELDLKYAKAQMKYKKGQYETESDYKWDLMNIKEGKKILMSNANIQEEDLKKKVGLSKKYKKNRKEKTKKAVRWKRKKLNK